MGRHDTLSAAAARRIALAAQGFARPRPALPPTPAQALREIDRLGLVQIDSVSAVVRSHYLPLFSRLGPYPCGLLDQLAYDGRRRKLFEYWGHEASLIPVRLQPMLRWRMARAGAGQGMYGQLARFARDRRGYVDDVLAEVRIRGALGAGDLADGSRGQGGWWGWSDGKTALEFLFWAGAVTTATRRGFERIYDLPERVLPKPVLALPDARARGRAAGAAAACRPRAGRRDRPRPARLFPSRRRRRAGAARRAGRGRPAPAGHRRGLGAAGLSRPGRARCRAGSTRAPCCRRSTRWCGSASAPSGSSASATGWRSTPRRTSGPTATTCCRSCWAIVWWPASTSRRSPGGLPARAGDALGAGRGRAGDRRSAGGGAAADGGVARAGPGGHRPALAIGSPAHQYTIIS